MEISVTSVERERLWTESKIQVRVEEHGRGRKQE
jgi:hypothetical protein